MSETSGNKWTTTKQKGNANKHREGRGSYSRRNKQAKADRYGTYRDGKRIT